ncbi:hypothetical protein ACIPY1_14410 [Paenarthrobacter nicotinovorans]|jgi:hypothetical protein|uniref:hypothetical protein n=1 Tax=Paenarthrobacter TaxID=1742992 RepID=UPI0027861841|nr:hypothetical protein [Paenarthrobacter nicotinovorans]
MNWQQLSCLAGFLSHVIATGSLIAAAFTGGATLVIGGIAYSVSALATMLGCS